jgi:hypothetical protein
MKKSRAKQRGTSNRFEVFRVLPELFSWLFYVAASRLNSPRVSSVLIRPAAHDCQVCVEVALHESSPTCSSLCNLCVLCDSVVEKLLKKNNHRVTENTEVAQRNQTFRAKPVEAKGSTMREPNERYPRSALTIQRISLPGWSRTRTTTSTGERRARAASEQEKCRQI